MITRTNGRTINLSKTYCLYSSLEIIIMIDYSGDGGLE